MDAATAVGQTPSVTAPLPVQDRRIPPGAVEVRAVENVSPGLQTKPEGRDEEFESQAPVVRLVRDFDERLADLIEQTGGDQATQAPPADTDAESGTPSDHVDTYA